MNILSAYTLDGNITANNIIVNGAVSATNSLPTTLSASGNITIGANVTADFGGDIALRADNAGTGVGTVTFTNGAQINSDGNVNIFFNPSVNPAGSAVNTTSYVSPTENFTGDVTGGATLTTYMLVNTLNDLQNVQNNLGGTYALSHNIDATATSELEWRCRLRADRKQRDQFVGTFNGQGIRSPGSRLIDWASGLSGFSAATRETIENIGVTNFDISGGSEVGGLVGYQASTGTISHAYSEGDRDGERERCRRLGGRQLWVDQLRVQHRDSHLGRGILFHRRAGPGAAMARSATPIAWLPSRLAPEAAMWVDWSAMTQAAPSAIPIVQARFPVEAAASYVGALVGYDSTTITNSFWDTDTAGVPLAIGTDPTNTTAGVTGATTAQLTSQAFILANATSSPTYDFTSVWSTVGDTLTPQLIGLAQTGLPTGPTGPTDMLSGTAFTDNGVTATGAGTTIDLIFDGSLLRLDHHG